MSTSPIRAAPYHRTSSDKQGQMSRQEAPTPENSHANGDGSPGAKVRVGIYARKSTNKQEDSTERQLASVLPYCERKGYALARDPYVDEGIAGDVFDKRPAFQKLLADAKAGLFQVIVTDEWSRLSRQEPIDFIARVVKPLKDAGVTLDCVAEGPQHWDDLAQLILMTVKASKSQDESKTKSYRVLTGARRAAALGRLLGSHPPYGYLVEYETVQEPGKPPRVRPVKLVPDPRRAHVVAWMFERYADGGWAMDDLARELNARGVGAPPRAAGAAAPARPASAASRAGAGPVTASVPSSRTPATPAPSSGTAAAGASTTSCGPERW